MTCSLMSILDGEDGLLHCSRGGTQPSQVAQVPQDLILILNGVALVVQIRREPSLPPAPIAPLAPCR